MGRMLLLGVGGLVLAVVAFKILLTIVGTVFGVMWFFFWKILPLILFGWLVLWLWRRWKERSAY